MHLPDSLAFWAAIFFVQGSVLFTIGSICLYPTVLGHLNATDEVTEELRRAWIEGKLIPGTHPSLLNHGSQSQARSTALQSTSSTLTTHVRLYP